MIELRSLGTAEIHTGTAIVSPSQTIAFAAGLYLIMERGKRIGRSQLATMLWPRVNETGRTHRLRQTIYQLKSLGVGVCADRNTLELPRTNVRVDAEKFLGARAPVPTATASLEFLPGYNPCFSEQFQDWLDGVREKIHSSMTRTLLASLREARNSGNWENVEFISRLCLTLDTYNEAAVLARAEACAMRGQKATALSILDRYIKEVGPENDALILPATVLRRRVLQIDDRQTLTRGAVGEPAFVGRGKEMATLSQFLDAARKGTGSGCLIDGDPGIGKTRLSTEFAHFAALQGLRVERVACKISDADQPLSAFVNLVPRLRELPGALGCAQSSLMWLKRLTEVDTSTQEVAGSTDDPIAIYTHLRSAVFDLLDAVSEERCLLIIVEDVQWLDRASARLFGAILEWTSSKKIFLLFNSRQRANPLIEAVSPQQITAIHLKPLADSDASALVQTLVAVAGDAVEQQEVGWLINAGDGNPYFLQELTKHWIESGKRHDLPASVASVLEERISRLSEVARQLLQACAVLGEQSNFERLEQVLGYRPGDLLKGMQELSTVGMLRSTAAGGVANQTLLVRHDLLAIEVLRGLAPTSLAFLHRRCGFILEQEALGTSISTSLMRACAFHWHHSGDSARAFNLAIKCADHLLELGLAADAVAAFEGALGFCVAVDRRIEVLGRIIQANRMAADRPALLAAIARLRELEQLCETANHHDDIEILELDTRRTTERELRPVLARTTACVNDLSLPAAHRVSAAVVAVKIATSLADMSVLENVYRQVNHLLADATVDGSARLQVQVIYHTMCGDLCEGRRIAKERVAFERARGFTLPLLNAMSDLAYVLRRTGPREEMLSMLREGYDIAIQHNHFATARDCAEKMGSRLQDDELPGSKEWMERAVENGKFANEIHASFSFNADSTRTALRENRLDDARNILDSGFDWAWLKERRMWLAVVHALRIRLLLAEKAKPSDVLSDVQGLKDLYRITARLGQQDFEVAALVQGLMYVGEPSHAAWFLDDYLSRTRRDLAPLGPELRRIVQQMGVEPYRKDSERVDGFNSGTAAEEEPAYVNLGRTAPNNEASVS